MTDDKDAVDSMAGKMNSLSTATESKPSFQEKARANKKAYRDVTDPRTRGSAWTPLKGGETAAENRKETNTPGGGYVGKSGKYYKPDEDIPADE